MTTSRGEMRHDHADRDPGPVEEWRPVSSEYRRREALEACRQAVAKVREAEKKPAGGTE